jgi:hypothetical protein
VWHGRISGCDHFLDSTIPDICLREFDWHIATYTFTEQWDLVLWAKWRRVSYMQKG